VNHLVVLEIPRGIWLQGGELVTLRREDGETMPAWVTRANAIDAELDTGENEIDPARWCIDRPDVVVSAPSSQPEQFSLF